MMSKCPSMDNHSHLEVFQREGGKKTSKMQGGIWADIGSNEYLRALRSVSKTARDGCAVGPGTGSGFTHTVAAVPPTSNSKAALARDKEDIPYFHC